MKKVFSISLGSSTRNAVVDIKVGKEKVHIERIGTDGDKKKAKELFKIYDGLADAFGLGGTDLYIYAGNTPYLFKDSAKLIAGLKYTPVLDGSGIKNSVEPYLVEQLIKDKILDFKNKKVLHVCGVDRFQLGKALVEAGAKVTFGDLIYGLGINIPLRNIKTLEFLARIVVPIITKFPINWFYPTGESQEKKVVRHPEYFEESNIIVGDFHFIKKYMPIVLKDKIIITNTVTTKDREMLKNALIDTLITITPSFAGRSFGTNVLEAVLVALSESSQKLDNETYKELIKKYNIRYEITRFKERELS